MEMNANINRVLIFIDKHLKDTITSDELARVAGYSEYHFIRVFKLCMNVKPMDYVRKRRLIKASEAIIDGMKIIDVAIILAELGTEAPYILAGMLCDISGKGVLSLEKLKDRIPPEIYKIAEQCQGVGSHLASAPDGIIIIKLAERLHNMRTIDFIDERKRSQKARETIELFMPFAIKSGNRKLIDELKDLGLKYYAAK